MTKAKRRNRRRKDEQGYDPNTPRCETCVHRQKECYATGDMTPEGVASGTWQPYIPARCTIGDFPVQPVGLCDDWEGRDGSTLEINE